jgi:predicted adenylyl cyclase CyaB
MLRDAPIARNVEVKARIADLAELQTRVRAIADHGPVELSQDDTFFHCPAGRLKLRTFSEAEGELIFYQRADALGPKESRYAIAPTHSPHQLRDTLAVALGACGRVRKRRTLYLLGTTRIHLDEVEGLGHFLEIEVILTDCQTVEDSLAIARRLMEQLDVRDEQLVAEAYVDLLRAGSGGS